MKLATACSAFVVAFVMTSTDALAQGERAPTRPTQPTQPTQPTRATSRDATVQLAEPGGRERAVRIPTKSRQEFASFWRKQPPAKAAKLEKELTELETRASRGESVEAELATMRTDYPEFFQISATLQDQPWSIANPGGGDEAAECLGIGWIGKNGKLRCIGKLSV